MIKFIVEGKPTAKERPRFTHRRVYTPQKTVNYEQSVRIAYLQSDRVKFMNKEPLSIIITAFYPIRKSASKKLQRQMLEGEIRPTVKPDFDNVSKIICDSLNGIAYNDDSQIVDATIKKFYSETPRVEVKICSLI